MARAYRLPATACQSRSSCGRESSSPTATVVATSSILKGAIAIFVMLHSKLHMPPTMRHWRGLSHCEPKQGSAHAVGARLTAGTAARAE
eukprot:2551277-Lingulodinium_polyedra.AAC.1